MARSFTPAMVAAREKYNAKAYDRIAFRVPSGDRKRLKEISKAIGTSVNQFILNAIHYYCEHHEIEF